jgi:peptidoglycan/xylan/chitin deacetylase (PgdA/CDA1 family)
MMESLSSRRAVPILMYHQVLPDAPPAFREYTVTARAFAAQMRWLSVAGYTPIGLDLLLAHRESGAPLPRRPVVITFDDGFRGCEEYAMPTLQACGFTATFYLVAGLVGRTSRWLLRARGIEFPIMSWNSARSLEAAGFTCAAHSLTHPRLGELSEAKCRDELSRSREILQQELGHRVDHLAYPFGSLRAETRRIAADVGYRSAVTVRVGLSTPEDDPLALHRVPISGEESLADFVCRVHSAHALGETLRRKAGRMLRHLRRGPSAPDEATI